MKRAVVTGFETFGQYMVNPSKWLALSVDSKIINDYKIHSLVLPSVVGLPDGIEDIGTRVLKRAKEVDASVIISFGVASEVKGFRLERSATNWIFNEKYCTSVENNQPIDIDSPAKEQIQTDLSQWDIQKMGDLFKKENIPFDSKISDDPGQFCCNGLIYRFFRARQEQNIDIPYLFVHMACTEESIELISDFDKNKTIIKKEDSIKALEIILQSFIG